MKKVLSMIVAVAMVLTMVCAFAVSASAANTIDFSKLELPTTWDGQTLASWDAYAKSAGDKAAENYVANVIGSDWWDLYTTMLYGMHPVIANFDGTTDVVAAYTSSIETAPANAVGTMMEAAQAKINNMSADEKAALSKEIAYFEFFYGKLDEFARNVYDADSVIANLRVIPSIAAAVVEPIMTGNPSTSDNGVMVAVAVMLAVAALGSAALVCRKKFN